MVHGLLRSLGPILVGLCGACATGGNSYFVKVDGISVSEAEEAKSFVIKPIKAGISEGDIQFREFATLVSRGLVKRGMVPAAEASTADRVIFIGYGISDPIKEEETFVLPIWGQTGISSSSTQGTLRNFGSYGTYEQNTTYNPTYGVTGLTQGTRIVNRGYLRYVTLIAVDRAASVERNESIQVWKTAVTSLGSSDDLRQVFPVMIGAATRYLGRNTGQKIEVNMWEGDPSVRLIKGLPATP